MARYIVGIDLGTTNSALAYIDLERKGKPSAGAFTARLGGLEIQTFAVPQLVQAGTLGTKPLLPSFLYLPGEHDLPPGATSLPWAPATSPQPVVGTFARDHGSKMAGRLVTSAKSWLSHTAVDRAAPLLPWGAPLEVPRLSPLEVSKRYLQHFVHAWNAVPGQAIGDYLEDLPVILTVPASFDEVARTLTVEAAKQAGLKHVTLLEEPQAAFYCWLGLHPGTELGKLKPGMRVLVVDVGGGTTDFSLIRTAEEKGQLTYLRDAVGDHLLLGGDNMDLALAQRLEPQLAKGGKLDAAQFGMLVQGCRAAKEQLLSPDGPGSVPVTVVGRGRSIVGGSLSANLTIDDVRAALFDGFFPELPFQRPSAEPTRAALHEMGLPYVREPAVTRHLADFLHRHLPDGQPDAILFNGGVFQPAVLRERLVSAVRPWYTLRVPEYQPLVLSNPSLDLAVAWGAAYFGWLKHTGGRRIGGGIARSYYLGVERLQSEDCRSKIEETNFEPPSTPLQSAIDHLQSAIAVVCVVPRHLEEGQEVTLTQPEMELAIGQPVTFPLFTSTVRGDDVPGAVLHVSPEQLLELPPLTTLLRGGKRGGVKQIPVTLAAKCTEIGTLELYCVARDNTARWRLEFTLTVERPRAGQVASTGAGPVDVFPENLVQAAATHIKQCYGTAQPAPAELTKALETALELPRADWPTGLCRRLWEPLLNVAEQRAKSPGHIARWYHLVGFCLRPGFGDGLDRFRVDSLWKKLNAAPGTTSTITDGGADFWVLWRRVAGGLTPVQQQMLWQRLKPYLLPGRSKPMTKPNANELAEMWRLAGSLERLDVGIKAQLADALLEQLYGNDLPNYLLWTLTRLGARQLVYGPLNGVVHPDRVSAWLQSLNHLNPQNERERQAWLFTLTQLARRTGQRALDIDDEMRGLVLAVLRRENAPAAWLTAVAEGGTLASEESSQLLGDALPIGLRLV
jgi:hypothetical protein